MYYMSSKKIKKITIKQIAKIAGVSFSTVAKALNDSSLVNKDTKKKILEIAEKLGYYPNSLAIGLRKRITKTIGVILNDLTNPYYYETIQEIEHYLSNRNYTMILVDSNLDLDTENRNIITMLSRGVDGLIISPVNSESKNIQIILDNRLKTVFIDVVPNIKDISYVYVKHKTASFIATEYLINNGHENILLLNGPAQLTTSDVFLKGYLKALRKHGFKINKSLIINNDISIDLASEKLINLHQDRQGKIKFTAVLCISDLAAMGVYKALKELGFSIPKDYSVVGYDNIFSSAYLNPPLTTIHSPKKRVGKISVNLLINQIENIESSGEKKDLEPHLVERKSVRKIN